MLTYGFVIYHNHFHFYPMLIMIFPICCTPNTLTFLHYSVCLILGQTSLTNSSKISSFQPLEGSPGNFIVLLMISLEKYFLFTGISLFINTLYHLSHQGSPWWKKKKKKKIGFISILFKSYFCFSGFQLHASRYLHI